MLTRISTASEAVLGREDADKVYTLPDKQIDKVLFTNHCGVIGKHSHSFLSQIGKILLGALCTHFYRFLLLLRLTRQAEQR